MADAVPLDERRELCAADVTLDGRPARIAGSRNDFATVRVRATGLGAEWSWPTVRRVVANGGEFRS